MIFEGPSLSVGTNSWAVMVVSLGIILDVGVIGVDSVQIVPKPACPSLAVGTKVIEGYGYRKTDSHSTYPKCTFVVG